MTHLLPRNRLTIQQLIISLALAALLAVPTFAEESPALPQPAVFPEDRVLAATETWEPPVIDESVKDTEPWLLVIKVAQEELGYTEGPASNETKYGQWYAGRRSAWCAEFLSWCVNESDSR